MVDVLSPCGMSCVIWLSVRVIVAVISGSFRISLGALLHWSVATARVTSCSVMGPVRQRMACGYTSFEGFVRFGGGRPIGPSATAKRMQVDMILGAVKTTLSGKTVLPLATVLLAEVNVDKRRSTLVSTMLRECGIMYPEQLRDLCKRKDLGKQAEEREQHRVWSVIEKRREREVTRARRSTGVDVAPERCFSGCNSYTAPIGGAPTWARAKARVEQE
eukprot:PhM_4_TR15915/c1_g3_i2/m.3285